MNIREVVEQFASEAGGFRALTREINSYQIPGRVYNHSAIFHWRDGLYVPDAYIMAYVRDHSPAGSLANRFASAIFDLLMASTVINDNHSKG